MIRPLCFPVFGRCLLTMLVCAAWLVAAGPSAAAETLRIQDPVTDNYKASYNADPSATELRTWFSIRAIAAGGTTWAPATPGQIQIISGGSVQIGAADGRTGTLTVRTSSGPLGSPLLRVDPVAAESRGRWGVLATVTSRDALRAAPATVNLTLSTGGATLATGTVQYRYDAAIAGVASDHIEYNGPGGRWYVGGVPVRMNWQPAPATAPSLVAGPTAVARPRVTSITLPLSTTRRLVSMRVSGRAVGGVRIRHVRVRIGTASWGRWVAVRASYSVTLPRGNTTRVVGVQLRDAAGRTSLVTSRRIRCYCG